MVYEQDKRRQPFDGRKFGKQEIRTQEESETKKYETNEKNNVIGS